jgi:hypothetical protein
MNEPQMNDSLCLLPLRDQRRNMALYAICAALVYMTAPITYVGVVHASLCNAMGASDAAANLPNAACYLAMTAPLFIAWRFHSAAAIKPVLAAAFFFGALACFVVAIMLFLPMSAAVRLIALTLHGGAIGAATGVTAAFQWEIISRGMEPHRRGLTLGLAYGIGPLFAVVGSIGAQLLIAGSIRLPAYSLQYGFRMVSVGLPPIDFPGNFAILFAAAAPLLTLAALLSTLYKLPPSLDAEPARLPLVMGLRRGCREFFDDPVLRRAMMAYLLVGAGGTVVSIMGLYTPEVMNSSSADLAGYQTAIRFAFKMSAGLLLGWLVARTNPKMGTILTAAFYLMGVLWVLTVPNGWFMICFGFMGAGDLHGVYFPNYIMTASVPDKVRYNVAFLQFMGLPICAAPTILGAISDSLGRRASFLAAAAMLIAALAVIVIGLPSRPQPRSNEN